MPHPDTREWQFSEDKEHKIYLWVEDTVEYRIAKSKISPSKWTAWVGNYCLYVNAKSVDAMIRRFRFKYPFLPIRFQAQNLRYQEPL